MRMSRYRVTIYNGEEVVKFMIIEVEQKKEAKAYASGLFDGLKETIDVTRKEYKFLRYIMHAQ